MGATSGQYWRWMGAFIEMHDRLRHIGKPTIARINGVCVGGGNELQMACDLSVHRRRRVHPARRPGARIGAGRRRDPVAAAHRRRSAGARDHHAVRAGLAGPGARVGAGVASRAARRAGRHGCASWRRSSRASCPRRCATRRPSSTGGATSSGRRPSSTPATGWRSTPPPTRRARRWPPSTRSARRASPSCGASRPVTGGSARHAARRAAGGASVLRSVRRRSCRCLERGVSVSGLGQIHTRWALAVRSP